MSGSRNHECRSSSRSSSSPTLIERLSCFHVSRTTSSREHRMAGRPFDPGARPVGDIDRQDAVHIAVAEELGRHLAPELKLRNAGQRPFGVDVDHVPVRRRQVATQIELHAVHPLHVRGQRAQIGERRVGGQQAAVDQRGDALKRERRQIIVATHHCAFPLLANGDAGDPSLVAQDLLDLRVGDVLHEPLDSR